MMHVELLLVEEKRNHEHVASCLLVGGDRRGRKGNPST